MAILFAASEIYPYAKSGGLADVAHSLPEALRTSEEVYTIMPLYRFIDKKKYEIVSSDVFFEYYLNGISYKFEVFQKANSKYDLFLYNNILCEKDELYGDSFGSYSDNGLRFGIFAYGILESMLYLNLNITAIHLNDWQTSLVALLAKDRYKISQKIIFTIHNLAYQGIFDKSLMNVLDLNWESCFKHDRFEYYDRLNFLKAGIFYSDVITTVSKTYANEIKTPYFGHTLDDILRNHSYKLKGILNGISYDEFNPKKDDYIYRKYNIRDFKYKTKNKEELLKDLNLKEPGKPLFVFIGRFTYQKGVDLLIESLHMVKDFEANMIILGSGEEHYNHIFRSFQGKYKNIHIELGYNEKLSRNMYAGADFLIMPSLFEPCGLNQMIAMKYGSVPIVAKTGGLRDSVIDFTDLDINNLDKIGVGITYEEQNLYSFIHAISKALSLYANEKKFKKISKHNMKVDNSWKNSAKEYLELYK